MFNQDQLHTVEAGAPKMPPPPREAEGDKASIDNTDIYYMPENFQNTNTVAGKDTNIKGIWVLGITIFLLIALGGGLYVYWSQSGFVTNLFGGSKTPPVVVPVTTDTPATNSLGSTTPTPAGSPREIYLAFRSELAQTVTVEAYMAVNSKYMTADQYKKITDRKAKLEADPASGDLLTALRGSALPALDGTEDISEASATASSTLTIKKTNNRDIGTVVFALEKEQWRIVSETWTANTTASGSTDNTVTADDDTDGLTNLEEVALGTNTKASDTDADTFSDLAELTNGYNPTGAGKLAEDKSLATYLNTTFNFSLLYPLSWERTIATTDDSIILTAPDKQFIQVLIQPNTNREDIISWYKRTFSVETIPTTQLYTSTGWEGVRTPDGLTVYLTNKDKSYVFVVTYNVGESKALNYRHIFETVLRSLKLAA